MRASAAPIVLSEVPGALVLEGEHVNKLISWSYETWENPLV